MTRFRAICDDAGMAPIEPESLDGAFFSPPYKDEDGYSDDLMAEIGDLLREGLKPGAVAFMNFGQLKQDFERPFRAAGIVASEGLERWQTIVWVKSVALQPAMDAILAVVNHQLVGRVREREREAIRQAVIEALSGGASRGHYQPLNSTSLLNYCHEYIFMLWKPTKGWKRGKPGGPKLDRISVGVPYADKSNLTRDTRGKHGDCHCAGDVWFVPYETTGQRKKKATAGSRAAYEFPVELPQRAFQLAGLKPGAVVLDPFMGSGSTAVAAKALGLDVVGIDRDEAILAEARRRWEEA